MDQATVEAACRGNRAAREALLRSLQDPWYRLCFSLLRDSEKAREATQETAVRVLKNLKRFRGGSSVMTWSMGIAINVVREMRRKERPNVWREEPVGESAHQEAERQEAWWLLHRVLEELSERQREAVVLRFFEELSVEETAAAMECAPGTVKATVHQALRAMRNKLKQLL